MEEERTIFENELIAIESFQNSLRADGYLSKKLANFITQVKIDHQVIRDEMSSASCKESSQNSAAASSRGSGLMWAQNDMKPRSEFEVIIFVAHSIVQQLGFQCVYEEENSPKGFAPSIKVLRKEEYLPKGFRNDPTSCTIMYRHLASKQLCLLSIVRISEESVVISFTGKTNKVVESQQIYVEEYLNKDYLNSCAGELEREASFSDEDGLKRKIADIVQVVIPPPAQKRENENVTLVVVQPSKRFENNFPNERAESTIPRVGESDLYPSFSGRFINDDRGLFGDRNGGSLVGPHHPIFRPEEFEPPTGPLPSARWDPIGPVIGPFGPAVGPSLPNRGGRGMRGRGPPRSLLHEPNPDHLRPPREDDNDYI